MFWCIDPEGQYKFIWGKIPRELTSTYSTISALDLQIVNLYPKVKWLGNLDLVLNGCSWGKWFIDIHICDWNFSVLDYKVTCMGYTYVDFHCKSSISPGTRVMRHHKIFKLGQLNLQCISYLHSNFQSSEFELVCAMNFGCIGKW